MRVRRRMLAAFTALACTAGIAATMLGSAVATSGVLEVGDKVRHGNDGTSRNGREGHIYCIDGTRVAVIWTTSGVPYVGSASSWYTELADLERTIDTTVAGFATGDRVRINATGAQGNVRCAFANTAGAETVMVLPDGSSTWQAHPPSALTNLGNEPPPPPADTTPPSQPTNLRETGDTQTSVTLTWNASTDNVGVINYHTQKNLAPSGNTPNLSHTITGLACGTSYNFRVRAVDAALNVSTWATLTSATASCSTPPPPPPPPDDAPNQGQVVRGQFNSDFPTGMTHRAENDPIVFPGQPGASHLHDFVGNRTADANSTFASLRAGTSNGHRGADNLSAYWMPTLYKNNVPHAPVKALSYYRAGDQKSPVRPFPDGLKMLAGDPAFGGPNQTPEILQWQCEMAGANTSVVPVQCPAGVQLALKIKFPNCWDGTRTDSPNHRDHVTYGYLHPGRLCPPSHPVAIPQVQLIYDYDVSGTPSEIGFARKNGGINSIAPHYTAHADLFDAWDKTRLRTLINHCINGNRDCGLGNDGPPM
jgi:hypothetical protein